MTHRHGILLALCASAIAMQGCGRTDHLGRPPSLTPAQGNTEQVAMMYPGLPLYARSNRSVDRASLWSHSSQSLLGDRRALKKGDILTVVIEIDDKAEISNGTDRSRRNSEELDVSHLYGLPQRAERHLPDGVTLTDAVEIGSSSESVGTGSIKREEELTLKIAATVVDVLPNGVLAIEGTQEVRVNFELRELLVSGFVRPGDISRLNQITYDKIASARISYGGRGQITDVQQPRYGQQVLDMILPF